MKPSEIREPTEDDLRVIAVAQYAAANEISAEAALLIIGSGPLNPIRTRMALAAYFCVLRRLERGK